MTTCPVCGKGEFENDHIWHGQDVAVSHLACVERLRIDLARHIDTALTANEALYAKGERIAELEANLGKLRRYSTDTLKRAEAAEREAAFWKWLWNHANPLTTAQGEKSESQWLAHMRERFEREAS
jgi:hypothetical protein